jgi:hypothetical protein
MSNKRRKSIGQEKLLRNRMIREHRGRRSGEPIAGDGRAFKAPDGWVLSAERERRRDQLADTFQRLVAPYWRGA